MPFPKATTFFSLEPLKAQESTWVSPVTGKTDSIPGVSVKIHTTVSPIMWHSIKLGHLKNTTNETEENSDIFRNLFINLQNMNLFRTVYARRPKFMRFSAALRQRCFKFPQTVKSTFCFYLLSPGVHVSLPPFLPFFSPSLSPSLLLSFANVKSTLWVS